MKSPLLAEPRSDQKNFLIFGFCQFIRSSDLWMRWWSLVQRGSNGILQGSTPTTRARSQWGSNHELTGADLWSRMWSAMDVGACGCGGVMIRADPVTTTTDRNPAKSRMDFEKISNRDLAVECDPVVVGIEPTAPPAPNC